MVCSYFEAIYFSDKNSSETERRFNFMFKPMLKFGLISKMTLKFLAIKKGKFLSSKQKSANPLLKIRGLFLFFWPLLITFLTLGKISSELFKNCCLLGFLKIPLLTASTRTV